MKFVRFGNIKAVKQKHFGLYDSFHSPPTDKGFYAMPHKAQEFFLIGSLSATQPHNFPKLPYSETVWEKWKDIVNEIHWDAKDEEYPKEYLEEMKEAHNKFRKRMNEIRKEFSLKNDDVIWHHLEDTIKTNEIIQRSGSWVSSRLKEYITAFDKEVARLKYRSSIEGGCRFSKDHFEIFVPFNI